MYSEANMTETDLMEEIGSRLDGVIYGPTGKRSISVGKMSLEIALAVPGVVSPQELAAHIRRGCDARRIIAHD